VFKSTNGLSADVDDISGDLRCAGQRTSRSTTACDLTSDDIGVFETFDGAALEATDQRHAERAVFGLAIDQNGSPVAATHGRGMFELSRGHDRRYRDRTTSDDSGDRR